MSQDLAHSSRARTGLAAYAHRRDIGMVVANVIGVLVYLWRAHYGWANPEARALGIDPVLGEPFIWAMGVLPVWALFLAANTAWAATIVFRRPQRGGIPFALVSVLWVVAVIVDFAHH